MYILKSKLINDFEYFTNGIPKLLLLEESIIFYIVYYILYIGLYIYLYIMSSERILTVLLF